MNGVDLELLRLLFERTRGRVRYELGAKPPIGASSGTFAASDCSGYVRWLLDRCGIRLPDGSQEQWRYVRDVLKWREVTYDDLRYTVSDPTRLFIAFRSDRRDPRGHYRYGHVWLVHSGRTVECYTRTGVGSRPWWERKAIASACYEVPVRRT